MSVLERFNSKHECAANGCWLWTASAAPGGYGKMGVAGRTVSAHRVAYELFIGSIPDGLEIDHLCRNKRCVNPAHLDVVTRAENERRKLRWPQVAFRCDHPFEPDNWYTLTNGSHYCRVCHLARCKRRNKVAA